jgi:hypothetical protein
MSATRRSAMRALLGAALLMAAARIPSPAQAAGRWLGAVEMGFDTYTERYSIAESDTLSSINEARTRLRLAWVTGSLGRNYTLLEGRQYIGQSSWESAAHGMLTRRLGGGGAWVVNLDGEIARRGFQEGSGYEFTNDYTRAYARAGVRARAGSQLTVRLDDRIENLNYDQRTEFDYDYTRNVATAMLDVGRDPFRGVSGGVRFSTMSIPDSTEIEYYSLGPMLELRVFGAPHERVYVNIAGERREYPDDGTRSSFRSVLISALLEWPLQEHWSLEGATDSEDYNYDVSTGAYDDYLESRNYMAVNWYSGGFKLGAGPAFGWLSSQEAPEEEYREIGVRLAMERIGVNGLYLWVSYEPGKRDYAAFTADSGLIDNADAIFSDYVYHRVNVFANARLYRSLWLNLFFDWQPEDHDRAGDDATATLGSISLMYQF